MALLERLRRWRTQQIAQSSPATARLYRGEESLEVVGESNYQDALWSLCGGVPGGERVRHAVVAVLVPEPENPYDENAISVRVSSHRVGYLDRATAASHVGGLRALVSSTRHHVALAGVIVGGGMRASGPGLLGVWLDHNPADFGVRRRAFDVGALRTGLSEAWLTDVEDDSYDLSWYDSLPENDVSAIALLRDLLASDPDPIDRHFQFAELESRLYRRRERDPSALHAYDVTCGRHDAEMESICAAFLEKWGKVPLLETYRQMAIRQQKRRDWAAVVWWTTRGLSLYGTAAARSSSVEDLLKRRHQGLAKLEAPVSKRPPPRPQLVAVPSIDGSSLPADPTSGISRPLETLTCAQCTTSFDRLVVRGRKPTLCPACRLGRA